MKRILRVSIGLLYLVLLLFNMVVLVKAGASIFYRKFYLDAQTPVQQSGDNTVWISVDTRIYNPASVLLLENGVLLEPVTQASDLSGKTGAYLVSEIRENGIMLKFSPSNTGIGERRYAVYIRPHLISSNTGGLIALLLMAGLLAFLISNLSDRQERRALSGSPSGHVNAWLQLFEPSGQRPAADHTIISWRQAASSTLLTVYLFVSMEWIFQATKSSFMDGLTPGEKLAVLPLAALILALAALAVLLAFYLLNLALRRFLPWFDRFSRHLPAALLTACMGLLLIDNFTYTVIKFGVVDTTTLVRLAYGLLFLALFAFSLRKFASLRADSRRPILPVVLLGSSLLFAAFSFQNDRASLTQAGYNGELTSLPNVILLSSDGLNAENMSVYGYERDTTPFFRELAKTSLVSQNHFTNAAHSMGSDTALLTSKSPFETRVLYPPDTLKGSAKYQHLPGILRQYGYYSVELGVPYYVDADIIDFRDAFDEVNCAADAPATLFDRLSGYGYDEAFYLVNTLAGRVTDRLAHVLFLKDMVDPLKQVGRSGGANLTDGDRMACLRNYIKEGQSSGQPLFAQVHLMDTHGGNFSPSRQVFSIGREQTDDWMTDFYDDAMLSFDARVRDFIEFLKANGQYQNTLLVVYTDHGEQFQTTGRLPLILHFPQDAHTGVLTAATQNLDIAPTVLDYLGIEVPAWMSGKTLLEEINPTRLIVAGSTAKIGLQNTDFFTLTNDARKPPFYQFSEVSVVQCQNWYRIDLTSLAMTGGTVNGYVGPCPIHQLDSAETIRARVGELLTAYGYRLPDGW